VAALEPLLPDYLLVVFSGGRGFHVAQPAR
jgi:hypothetical protein